MAPALSTVTRSDVYFDFWACQRPLTSHWGSGQVLGRIQRTFGKPDAAFGKQDNVGGGLLTVDLDPTHRPTVLADWHALPFIDNAFRFSYWDPPYYKPNGKGGVTLEPHLYKKEGQEIWRVSERLAILHTHVWPRAWLDAVAPSVREAMVAITMGPMKATRMLQVFRKATTPPLSPNKQLTLEMNDD